MFLPRAEALAAASTLHQLHSEISAYCQLDPGLVELREDEIAYTQGGTASIAGSTASLFDRANEAIAFPSRASIVPQSHLAHAVVAAIEQPDFVEVEADDVSLTSCFEAELRLVRSLGDLARGRAAEASLRPAGVFFDIGVRPFAIRKRSDLEIDFAWRDALIETEEGQCFVPHGSWLKIRYAASLARPCQRQ